VIERGVSFARDGARVPAVDLPSPPAHHAARDAAPAGFRAAGRVNKDWHATHRMPRNATLEQRVRWHREHARACACREMPASIRKAIEKRK
jgi:hypothetical protein